jgi:nucleoid-associated protein YgaU
MSIAATDLVMDAFSDDESDANANWGADDFTSWQDVSGNRAATADMDEMIAASSAAEEAAADAAEIAAADEIAAAAAVEVAAAAAAEAAEVAAADAAVAAVIAAETAAADAAAAEAAAKIAEAEAAAEAVAKAPFIFADGDGDADEDWDDDNVSRSNAVPPYRVSTTPIAQLFDQECFVCLRAFTHEVHASGDIVYNATCQCPVRACRTCASEFDVKAVPRACPFCRHVLTEPWQAWRITWCAQCHDYFATEEAWRHRYQCEDDQLSDDARVTRQKLRKQLVATRVVCMMQSQDGFNGKTMQNIYETLLTGANFRSDREYLFDLTPESVRACVSELAVMGYLVCDLRRDEAEREYFYN